VRSPDREALRRDSRVELERTLLRTDAVQLERERPTLATVRVILVSPMSLPIWMLGRSSSRPGRRCSANAR
jgi:hypothetical protein